MDISADLDELARTPVTVVCAGPKSILDVGRTLEALETRGVPVLGWQSDEVAGFYSRSSGHRAPSRVDSAEQAARLIAIQRALGLATGILVTVPLPPDLALPDEEVAAAVEQAEAEAAAAGIHGPASTPFVLGRVAASSRTVAAFAPTWPSSSAMPAWPARSPWPWRRPARSGTTRLTLALDDAGRPTESKSAAPSPERRSTGDWLASRSGRVCAQL